MSTWVLLRGLMRDRRHWGAFLPAFAARVAPTPVIAIDFPGNGERHRQTSLPTIAATTDFVRAELARLRVSGPVSVLAMSMGAMVTADWAQRHPQEIERALLVNTSLRPFSRVDQRLQPAAWPLLLRMLVGAADAQRAEQTILQLTSNRTASATLLDDWIAWRHSHPVSTANALRQLGAAMRYSAPRQAPPVPIRLLNGAGDRLVDPACSRQLAQAWGCELRVHPSAGHDLPLDDPQWVIEQALDFAARR